MDSFYFLSFDSTNHALQAESYLKNKNISISVIPTPREVTQSCGLSIKLNDVPLESIRNIIGEGIMKIKGLYYLDRRNGVKNIEKVD
jgi:hypothetical protein